MGHLKSYLLFAALLVLVAFATFEVKAQVTDSTAAADSAYQQKDWPTAEKLYGELTQSNPKNKRFWYRLGVSERAMGNNQKALQDFQQAQANGLPLALVGFDLACAYSSVGQKEKALETLTGAIKQGFGQPERMSSEPALQPLKSDPRFAKLLAKAARN